MVYAVILAGGTGERFWPLSRQDNPKQFLRLFGEQTMLQQTVSRVAELVEPDHIYVVTGQQYHQQVVSQLSQLPLPNIICEPFGRDTAPAIGLAAEYINRRDPGGTMVVLPADHYITDVHGFHGAWTRPLMPLPAGMAGYHRDQASEPATVTVHPYGQDQGRICRHTVYRVLEFKENRMLSGRGII